jgi:ABC-2 type transport system permease protein
MKQKAAGLGTAGPSVESFLRAVFMNVHFILLLVVPAVTMSSLAGERANHAIRILLSSSIGSGQIIFGKFLGIVMFMTLALLASCVFPAFAMIFGNPQPAVILTGVLGVFLLMLSQVAICLFVSSLTKNQLLAFLLGVFSLFLLIVIGYAAENQIQPGRTQEILKYLAQTDHLDLFLKGVISSKSIGYFLTSTGLFLYLSFLSLNHIRKN